MGIWSKLKIMGEAIKLTEFMYPFPRENVSLNLLDLWNHFFFFKCLYLTENINIGLTPIKSESLGAELGTGIFQKVPESLSIQH